MSRPSRLGHQAAQTFDTATPESTPIDPPVWLVFPLLWWSRLQLTCLEAMEPYLPRS
ncbi:MAG: hypothetical protein KF760_18350 [Candidatus Eremiobacteraeota bacterium]|nr:hypothetical protein [Candidatus Eremiobacteraeota bacterium]MCW5869362.1 hypothetical protein [Candidatus Eremiobacteraeota bacterium]